MAERIELFYGQWGTGKSEGAARIARRVYEQSGLLTRVLIGDGSRATYEDAGLVDAGVVQIAGYTGYDYPSTTLQQFTEGYWPADAADPRSKLMPPTPEGLKKIGVYIVEGMSVGANYIMGDKLGGLAARAAKGEKIGQDSPIRYVDGDTDALGNPKKNADGTVPLQFGGNPLSHFQVAQKRMLGFVDRSSALPVKWVIWTAHEKSVEDKLSKETVIGPEVAGGALTANLGRHFGNTLHFVTVEKRLKDKDAHTGQMIDDLDVEYRIYTRDHVNPRSGIKYKAVTRGGVTEKEMPLYLTDEKPGDSVERYYGILQKIRQERAAAMLVGKAAA